MIDTPKPNANVTQEDGVIPFKGRVTDAHRETANLILEWYCSPFKNSPSALAECARLIAHKEADAVEKALSTATEDRYNLALLNEARDLRRQLAEADARADALRSYAACCASIHDPSGLDPLEIIQRAFRRHADDHQRERSEKWKLEQDLRADRNAAHKQVEALREAMIERDRIDYQSILQRSENEVEALRKQWAAALAALAATAPTPPAPQGERPTLDTTRLREHSPDPHDEKALSDNREHRRYG